jgi:hypothetical protein
VFTAKAKHVRDKGRSAHRPHAQGVEPIKDARDKLNSKRATTDLRVKVESGERKVEVTSIMGRRGSTLVNNPTPRKRVRRRDYCRQCKTEECDHCYCFEEELPSSGDEG